MTDFNFEFQADIEINIASKIYTSESYLRYLIDVAYPEIVANLNIILGRLDEQLGLVQTEITTINDTVLDISEANILSLLEAKRVSNAWYGPVDTFGQFGILNLTDWQIWDVGIAGAIAVTGIGPDTFTMFSDTTPSFPINSPVTVNPGGIIRLVASSSYAIGPNLTTVVLQAGAPIPLGVLTAIPGQIVYVYLGVGWDSDAAITQEIVAFDLGWHHLYDEPGLGGTYGLVPKESNIQDGITVQTNNRDKYLEFIAGYEPYAA